MRRLLAARRTRCWRRVSFTTARIASATPRRACHTGAVSCFFQTMDEALAGEAQEAAPPLDGRMADELAAVIAQRHRDQPEGSYVAGLLRSGIDRVVKKVGEEAAETIIAAKN